MKNSSKLALWKGLYLVSHSNRVFDSRSSLAGRNPSTAAAKVEINALDGSRAACSPSECPYQSFCVGSVVILCAVLITGGNLTKPFAALPAQYR